jgi:hypothetical protein
VELRWLGDHRLDRFVLAAPTAAPPIESLQLVSATHSVLGDVKSLLTTADSAYAVLDVGETIDLVFEAPDAPPIGTRRYLFDSKGYYLLFEGKTGSERPSLLATCHIVFFCDPRRRIRESTRFASAMSYRRRRA